MRCTSRLKAPISLDTPLRFAATRVFEGSARPSAPLEDSGRGETSFANEAAMKPVRIGLVGSGFVSTIHAEALKRVPGAELFAVTSPTGDNAAQFAQRHGVRHHFRDYRKFLEAGEVDLVVLGCPNDLHCEYA